MMNELSEEMMSAPSEEMLSPAVSETPEAASSESVPQDLPQTLQYVDWEKQSAPKSMSPHEMEMLPLQASLSVAPEATETAQPEPSIATAETATIAPVQPAPAASAEEATDAAKEAYWRRALTGNPDTVPEELRRRACAGKEDLPVEEQEYDMLASINRSWLADHSDLSRETIADDWAQLRAGLASQYGVADDEAEVFAGISRDRREADRVSQVKQEYEKHYLAALRGLPPENEPSATSGAAGSFISGEEETESSWQSALRERARRDGALRRAELTDKAGRLAQLLGCMQALENDPAEGVHMVNRVPMFTELADELSRMEEPTRRELYEVALSMVPTEPKLSETDSLLTAMWRSGRRGLGNISLGLAQSAGNLGVAALRGAEKLAPESSAGASATKLDASMRLLEELRRYAQEGAYPIALQHEQSFWENLALETAEALPAAALSFCGNAGFAISTTAGLGAQVAALRQEMPEGSLTLQTGAGIAALGVQAAASAMLNKIGATVFSRILGKYATEAGKKAAPSLFRKIGTAATDITSDALKDVYLGRLGDRAAHEFVARMDGLAEAIDWQSFGDDWDSIEQNLHEAALNLPYVLIGSGHVALHHFRNPRGVVGEEAQLAEWGIDAPTRRLILHEPDVQRQGRLLYDALHNGKRWGGLGFFEDAARALRLLHTEEFHPFERPENVREFLQLPAETAPETAQALVKYDSINDTVFHELAERHAPGEDVSKKNEVLPLLRLSQEWLERAFYHKVSDYPRSLDLVPADLTRIGDHSEATEAQRREALQHTVDYLDALTYRLLLNSTSFGTMRYSGRTSGELKKEADALRRQLIGKVAESVLVRAGGASPEAADEVFGQFISDYYTKSRHFSGYSSWLRYVPPAKLSTLHRDALSERALRRGPELRRGRFPELQEAYWSVQGLHHCSRALVRLLPHQPAFQAALSRGMTPQEAYAHVLNRELGDRLPESDWFPRHLTEDTTDRAAVEEKNRAMADKYRRLTGISPEQGEDADGNPLWRIQTPDSHYTHWHATEADCLNELAVTARMRYLPLGEDMSRELLSSAVNETGYDAERLGMDHPWRYSYFDRLSSVATGDLKRFWMEDATRLMPGITIGPMRNHSSFHFNSVNPYFMDDPDYYGVWTVDGRSVLTPYSIAKARFETYWRNQLTSGWLNAKDAADFLRRRTDVSEDKLAKILELGEVRVRHLMTPAIFFSGADRSPYLPYADTDGMHYGLAKHLADYTTGYFLAHLNEMPLPDSVREWFALTPFRLDSPLYVETASFGGVRARKGRNDPDQSVKWTHRAAAEQVKLEVELAEKIRSQEAEDGPDSLHNDPFFPLIQEALENRLSRRAEQGWGYCDDGMQVFLYRRSDMWNLLEDPARQWPMLGDATRRFYQRNNPEFFGSEDSDPQQVPEPLVKLSAALKEYPELHLYDYESGDEERLMRLDFDDLTLPEYNPSEDPFARPDHSGDGVIRNGFTLQKMVQAPERLRTDPEMREALRTLSTLRRAIVSEPYSDAEGNILWDGEVYGGKNGRKPNGVGDEWHYCEPMAEIMRIFSEMPQDGSSVMDLGVGTFSARPSLPEKAMNGISVYRSPEYPLSQLRLMPGEYGFTESFAGHPYVVQSFVGAPMWQGTMVHNKYPGTLFLIPMRDFAGDVTKEYIGHMAGWRGQEAVNMCLDELMRFSESPESVNDPSTISVPLSEVLMQLTEDSRFSRSLAGRAPHELTLDEATAATWFHTLARYVHGTEKSEALNELFRFNQFFREHPERMESLKTMLHERRLRYDLDPNDVWEPVVAASKENRHFKALQRELEHLRAKEQRRQQELEEIREREEMTRRKHKGYLYRPSSDDY